MILARTIPIVPSVGHGVTAMSAFDRALLAAGVGNTNLIRLSSVIPAGWTVMPAVAVQLLAADWGDRLYVVQSDARSDMEGMRLAAGVGWVVLPHGGGIMVEHHAEDPIRSERQLADRLARTIRASLMDMVAARGADPQDAGMTYGETIATVTVDDRPACALVTAVYGAVAWTDLTPLPGPPMCCTKEKS